MATPVVRDALPINVTKEPNNVGKVEWNVRGRTTWCTTAIHGTPVVKLVLSRFPGMVRTVLCNALVVQVFIPSENVTIVEGNVGTATLMDGNLKKTMNNRISNGAL